MNSPLERRLSLLDCSLHYRLALNFYCKEITPQLIVVAFFELEN